MTLELHKSSTVDLPACLKDTWENKQYMNNAIHAVSDMWICGLHNGNRKKKRGMFIIVPGRAVLLMMPVSKESSCKAPILSSWQRNRDWMVSACTISHWRTYKQTHTEKEKECKWNVYKNVIFTNTIMMFILLCAHTELVFTALRYSTNSSWPRCTSYSNEH